MRASAAILLSPVPSSRTEDGEEGWWWLTILPGKGTYHVGQGSPKRYRITCISCCALLSLRMILMHPLSIKYIKCKLCAHLSHYPHQILFSYLLSFPSFILP